MAILCDPLERPTTTIATDSRHQLRLKPSYVKIVLQSGTGMRIKQEFVVVHVEGRDAIDVHLDGLGEALVPVPHGMVDVEFPAYFAVRHVSSTPERDLPPRAREAVVQQGQPVVGMRREAAARTEPSGDSKAPVEHSEPGSEDEDDEVDFDLEFSRELDFHNVFTPDNVEEVIEVDDQTYEEDEGEAEDDELEVAGALPQEGDAPFEWKTPMFSVWSGMTHLFEISGELHIKLSRTFFRDKSEIEYDLSDEDGEPLLSGIARSQFLTFPRLGLGTYTLKVAGVSISVHAGHSKGIQFLGAGQENG